MICYHNQTVLVCIWSVLFSLAAATNSALIPLTVEVPVGTTQHGNPRMLCPPTTALTLATFFLGNFLAHVATIKSVPGEKLPVTVCNMILALMFPTSGLMRGLNAIARCVKFGKSELDKACRAGALCVVVRNSHWRPGANDSLEVVIATSNAQEHTDARNAINIAPSPADLDRGEVTNDMKNAKLEVYHPTWLSEDQRWWIFFDTIWGRATVNALLFDIHGTYRLPNGYSFATLPRNTIVQPSIPNLSHHGTDQGSAPGVNTIVSKSPLFKQNSDIASNWSVLKILASISQLLFSYFTLYRYQGDQIKRWGYVSFFFTPLPYAVMSFCNGVSNLLTPDYPKLYMVHSEVMDEAKEAGGAFEGVVGRVIPVIEPMDDESCGFGFATTWKGISPTSMKRVFQAMALALSGERSFPKTMETATCSVSLGSDNMTLLQTYHMENGLGRMYQISSTFTKEEEVFGPTSRNSHGMLRSPSGSSIFIVCFMLYCCIRHPQRTKRCFLEWNKNPQIVDIPRDLILSAIYGICLLLWSVCHPHRVTRFLKKWNKNPWDYLQMQNILVTLVHGICLCVWSICHPQRSRREMQQRLAEARRRDEPLNIEWLRKRLLGHKSRPTEPLPDQTAQATVYYRSCSRFQRYEDVIRPKHVAATIPNSPYIASAPATNNVKNPLTSYSRSVGAITWRSALLPVSFGLLLSCVPVIIIGILSQFQPGASSPVQRVIILIWWISGSILGLLMPLLDVSEILVCIVWLPAYLIEQGSDIADAFQTGSILNSVFIGMSPTMLPSLPMFVVMLAFVPWSFFVAPVWGFVIVAQMLKEWGSCHSLY